METKKSKKVKLHIKSGDLVLVIAGNSKGEKGTVQRIIFEKNRAIVEGLNIVKKHIKATSTNPNGSIVEKEASIHVSNLMVIDPKTSLARRTGRKEDKEGKLQRYFKEHTSLQKKK